MADSYRDIAQVLLDRANLRFQSKGTPYDVLYSEQETIDRSTKVGQFLDINKPHLPAKCIPGAVHPKCDYLILVDAYRTGGDDHHDNWTLLYRVDVLSFVLVYNEAHPEAQLPAFPDILKNDNKKTDDQYGTGGTIIDWQFDVINQTNYVEATMGAAHPDVADAFLIGVVSTRNGPMVTVQRRYQKFPALLDYEYEEETRNVVKTTRQIVHSTTQPSTPGAGTDVQQTSLGTEFSLRTTRILNLGSAPTMPTVQAWVDWSRPRILGDATHTGINPSLGADGQTLILNYDIRTGYTKKFQAKIVTEFFSSPPAAQTLLQVIPQDLLYTGIAFNVNVHNVLNDSVHVFDSTSVLSEGVTFAASSPVSKSDYLALVTAGTTGTYQKIAEQVTRWKYGWWKRETISIKPE